MKLDNEKIKNLYLWLKKKAPDADTKTIAVVSGFIASSFSDFRVSEELKLEEEFIKQGTGKRYRLLRLDDGSEIIFNSGEQLEVLYLGEDDNNNLIMIAFDQDNSKLLSSITVSCCINYGDIQYVLREGDEKNGRCLIQSESFPAGDDIEFFVNRNTNIDDVYANDVGSGLIPRLQYLFDITDRAFLLYDNCKNAHVDSPSRIIDRRKVKKRLITNPNH